MEEKTLTPDLAQAVEQAREVFITTYDSDGKPGTVPVWFDYHQGMFYISTPPDSLKCQKIHNDPRVKLTFGTRGGPNLIRGTARVVAEHEIIDRIAPIHYERYQGGLWRSSEHLAQQWKEGKARVLLEITV